MSGDAERLTENFALELFNWHLANNPKIHDLCLHAQEMAIALAATTVDHTEKGLGMVNKIMEQAQMFASSWSLVDTKYDDGTAYAVAENAKKELHEMVTALVATANEWEERERCISEHYEAACKSIDELSIENERLVEALQKEVSSPTFMGKPVFQKPAGAQMVEPALSKTEMLACCYWFRMLDKHCGILLTPEDCKLRDKLVQLAKPTAPEQNHFVDANKLVEKMRALLNDPVMMCAYPDEVIKYVIRIVEGEV